MENEKLKKTITFITAMFVFLVVISFIIFSRNIFKKHAFYTVQQVAVENAMDLDTCVNYGKNSIELISNFVSSKMTEKELKNPNKILNQYSGNTPFNFIEYIRWDGLNYMNGVDNPEPFDATDREYYKKGMKGETGIWLNFKPKASKETLMNFYTPLYYEDKIAGVLTGVIGGKKNIKDILSESFLGHEMLGMLLDENFRIVSTNDDDIQFGISMADYTDDDFVSEIIAYAEASNSEPFSFVKNGREGLCCVANMNSTGWHIVMIVYPRTLNAILKDVTDSMYLSILLIIIALVIYSFINLYINRRERTVAEESHLNIINAMSMIYENVYVVNGNTSDVFIYKTSNRVNEEYSETLPSIKYEDGVKVYTQKEVYSADIPLFEALSTVDRVKEILEESPEYTFTYRTMINGELHYRQCCLLNPSESSPEFVVAFKNIDDIVQKQLKEQEYLNSLIDMQATQITTLSAISGIYLTSHLIDLQKNIFVEYNTSEQLREVISDIENADLQMEKAIRATVSPENLDEVLAFTNLRTIARRLKGKKIISKEFKGRFHGWTRASFISVETDADDLPFKVLYVTQVIDDEKRRVEKLISSVNGDELTGLLNRHAYEEALRGLKKEEPSNELVYISFDVNGLKTVNDTLGHEAGDELIIGAAECLEDAFAKYGNVYRTGGDEFQGIIYASSQELEEIKMNFERIMADWCGKLVDELRISAGYVQKSENPVISISEMVRLADERMYAAKSIYYSSKGVNRRMQQTAYEVLCNSYTKILEVNLTEDSYSVIQMNAGENDSLKGYNDKISAWLHDFGTSGQVHPDDIDEYLDKTDFDFIKKFFESGNKILSLRYRRKIGDKFHHAMLEMIPSKNYSRENQVLYLCVKDIGFAE